MYMWEGTEIRRSDCGNFKPADEAAGFDGLKVLN
jgi:hypothetical protein